MGSNPERIQRGSKLCVDHWWAHTSFSPPQNKTVKGGEKKDMQWLLFEAEKKKCSGATCPLPMSHAVVSPLVGEPWGRALLPGQSASGISPIWKSFQVSSCEGGDWSELRWGEGRAKRPNQRATPQTGWKTSDGFLLQRQGSAVGKQSHRYALSLDFDQTLWALNVD